MGGILNPGSFPLLARTLTTAITGELETAVDGFEGIQSATIKCQFAYGSGGTTAKFWVQCSIDGGNSFQDVACFAFTTASATKEFNVSALTPVTTAYTPTDGTMADDTCKDGILGPIWRVKSTTTGTYANTNVAIYIEAR
jgi:hypothetical protein